MNESPSEIYERETGKRIGTETLTGGLLTIRDFGTREYISFLESNFRRIPWKKYPEEKPETGKRYMVTVYEVDEMPPGFYHTEVMISGTNDWLHPETLEPFDYMAGARRVIAFQPLPEPYKGE